MDRNLVSALTLVSTATLAVVLVAMTPGNAYADDITIDTTPFASTRTRAEVQSELFSQAALVKSGVGASEWKMNSNPALPQQASSTRAQAQAEYKASRDYVHALLSEDSGSAYFMKSAPPGTSGTSTMGGPAR